VFTGDGRRGSFERLGLKRGALGIERIFLAWVFLFGFCGATELGGSASRSDITGRRGGRTRAENTREIAMAVEAGL